MDYKKTISIFFCDADLSKRVKASISGSYALTFKVPKSCVPLCNDKPELNNSGIYFLIGKDENGVDAFYVGQADTRKNNKGIINRATEPHPTISYWQTIIAVTTKDNSLDSAKISYLENKFYNLAKDAGRYSIKNGNEPSLGNPSEEMAAEMDEFISHVLMMVFAMGYKIFESIEKVVEGTPVGEVLTYSYLGLLAKGIVTDDGFLLLKGSELRDLSECQASVKPVIPKLRELHKDKIANNVVIKDIPLNSTSQAAKFCILSSVSGNASWKDSKGHYLK